LEGFDGVLEGLIPYWGLSSTLMDLGAHLGGKREVKSNEWVHLREDITTLYQNGALHIYTQRALFEGNGLSKHLFDFNFYIDLAHDLVLMDYINAP
jgi:hypothetical protein